MRMVVLTEIRSEDHLRGLRSKLEELLALPGVADHYGGLSIRMGANVANPSPGDWTPFDRIGDLVGEICAPFLCEAQLRLKYGRTTPRHGQSLKSPSMTEATAPLAAISASLTACRRRSPMPRPRWTAARWSGPDEVVAVVSIAKRGSRLRTEIS